MTENMEAVAEVKQLHDLNLKALADDLAEVLSKHVGGNFTAKVTKLEHTNPGFIDDKLLLNFRIEDKSHMERFRAANPGGFGL